MAIVTDKLRVLHLDPADQIGVALDDLAPGAPAGSVRATMFVPKGHKIALRDIAAGDAIRKFGAIIGEASADIRAGEHVHLHNLAFRPTGASRSMHVDRRKRPAAGGTATFAGYVRDDGRVGT